MIVQSLAELNLHDSELIEMRIKMDEVFLLLDYIKDYKTLESERCYLVFGNCSEVNLKINPGVLPPDSIRCGEEWTEKTGKRVRIEMNTSTSVIEIVAQRMELIQSDGSVQ
jgi:hypothetical protein